MYQGNVLGTFPILLIFGFFQVPIGTLLRREVLGIGCCSHVLGEGCYSHAIRQINFIPLLSIF